MDNGDGSACRECTHVTPKFGCEWCVCKDKLGVLEVAKKDPPPPCPECGQQMRVHESDPTTMEIDYICPSNTDDYPSCGGFTTVKVKR